MDHGGFFYSALAHRCPGVTIDSTAILADHESMTDLTRQELDAILAASEAKVETRLANFDMSIKVGFADLRAEFAHIRTDMAKLQAEIHKNTADLIKWGVAIAVAIVGATVGLMSYINKVSDTQPVQPSPVTHQAPARSLPSTVPAPSK